MEISTNLSSSSRSRLVLISTGPAAYLAAGTLAQHLGISRSAAVALLGEAPAVLAESLEPELASQLATLLRSFGLRVRLDQTLQSETLWDVSIQLSAAVRLQRTVRIVAEHIGLTPAEVEQRLGQPGASC